LRQQPGVSGWQDTVHSEAEDLGPDFVAHVNTLAAYGTLATALLALQLLSA